MSDTIQERLRHQYSRNDLNIFTTALEAADEIDRLRELLVETRAQIGMNTCGGDLHSPMYWAFLEHLSKELDLDPRRLCEPGYPRWKPNEEESEAGINHMVDYGMGRP